MKFYNSLSLILIGLLVPALAYCEDRTEYRCLDKKTKQHWSLLVTDQNNYRLGMFVGGYVSELNEGTIIRVRDNIYRDVENLMFLLDKDEERFVFGSRSIQCTSHVQAKLPA